MAKETIPHLRLPNDVVEALAKCAFLGARSQVLWALWRKTLCWQHPGEWQGISRPVGIADISEATGLPESTVKRTLAELQDQNLITRDTVRGRGIKPATGFNLKPASWKFFSAGADKGSEGDTHNKEEKGSQPDTLANSGMGSNPNTFSGGMDSNPNTHTDTNLIPFSSKSDTHIVPNSGMAKETLKETLKESSSTERKGETTATTAAVFQFITDNFPSGTLTDFTASQVNDFIGEYGSENVMFALREACTNNHRNMAYARGILERLAKERGTPAQERAGPYRGPVRMPPRGETPHLIIGPQNSQ